MNLFSKLSQRAAEGRPLRVGLIGAGKFGSMYLAQLPHTPGVHLVGIADLSPANAQASLARVGWPAERSEAGKRSSRIPRSRSSSSAPAIRSRRSTTALLPSGTASTSST
jgi:predicted homoserine dehydrogenase-like protein